MFINQNVVEVDAPPEQVWAILADLATWSDWNPTIHQVDGVLQPGRDVVIHVGDRSAPHTWTCTVARHIEGHEFSWTFQERRPRLFRGEHIFRLEPLDDRRTRFVDQEDWHGLLVPFRQRELGGPTKAGMVAMDAALKQHAERRP